jgi:hypothetical protein
MLRIFALVVSLLALTVLNVKTCWGQHIGPDEGLRPQCVEDGELARTVLSLSNQYEAEAAQRFLRHWVKRSSGCRERVIFSVMEAMDKPNLDISRDQASADLWREGARLLGDLKATQSLDLLLSRIKMTDGEWSSTMTHQPALEGIIRMGAVAIPKLEKLLRHPDWQTRRYAVYCLARIGGISARRVLQKDVLKETDRCVRHFIEISIKVIDVKNGGVKQDHGEWAAAFDCKS